MRTQSANVKHKYQDNAIDAVRIDVTVADQILGTPARWLLVGGAGAVDVTTVMGNRVVIPAVPAGLLPLCVKTVHTAGTSATNVTALM